MGSAGGDTNPKTTFHPAFTVSNIRNAIPLTLNQTDDHYASWVEFFNIHVCAYNVKDHIDEKAPRPADVDNATWERLDALVKQWIYSTISPYLGHSIMKVGASALDLWKSLQDIFLNNKTTRVVYLEEQFNNTRLASFSNVTEYCARLKNLADQLHNVGNPSSETKMVLQLISGLTKGEYDTVATFIQQTEPLPTFNQAKSSLFLEERWFCSIQPLDNSWYMDSASTSHLTNDEGKLSNFTRFTKDNYILVGNGARNLWLFQYTVWNNYTFSPYTV